MGRAPELGYGNAGRGYPDVSLSSYDYLIRDEKKIICTSGTALSAAVFAGMITSINAARLADGKGSIGWLNPTLYANPHIFEDMIIGDSSCDRNGRCRAQGFSATKGWDPISGLGSVDYATLEKLFLSHGSKSKVLNVRDQYATQASSIEKEMTDCESEEYASNFSRQTNGHTSQGTEIVAQIQGSFNALSLPKSTVKPPSALLGRPLPTTQNEVSSSMSPPSGIAEFIASDIEAISTLSLASLRMLPSQTHVCSQSSLLSAARNTALIASPTVPVTAATSIVPIRTPSITVADAPGVAPSVSPSVAATGTPSALQSMRPSVAAIGAPSIVPSVSPSVAATAVATARIVYPSLGPSVAATGAPTSRIVSPSAAATGAPTARIGSPSVAATGAPTARIGSPSAAVTTAPGVEQSMSPSAAVTGTSSAAPSVRPIAVAIFPISKTLFPSTAPQSAPPTLSLSPLNPSLSVDPSQTPSVFIFTQPSSLPTSSNSSDEQDPPPNTPSAYRVQPTQPISYPTMSPNCAIATTLHATQVREVSCAHH